MALSKLQTALVCCVVGLVPLSVGWIQSEDRDKQTESLRARIAEQSKGFDRLKGELARMDRQVKIVDREIVLQQNRVSDPAKLRKRQEWSDGSGVVEIPKNILQQVNIPSFATNTFTTSRVLEELLAIEPAEAAQIQPALESFHSSYNQLARSRTRETDRTAAVPPLTGKSFVIDPFRDEGKAIAEELHASLIQILGADRGEIYWKNASNDIQNLFAKVGDVERVVTWVEPTDPRKPVVYYEKQWYSPGVGAPINARGHVYVEAFAPEPIRALHNEWKRKQP